MEIDKAIQELKELKDNLEEYNFENRGYADLSRKEQAIDRVLEEIGKANLEKDTQEEVLKWKAKYHLLSRKIDVISKDKIRKFIKDELPDDEIMECCEMFDSNGIYLRKKLEELLEE